MATRNLFKLNNLLIIILISYLSSCSGFKSVKPSEYGNLVMYKNDNKIEYQVYMFEIKKIDLDEAKLYFWSKNNEIFFTQGNYSGRLLHGKYSMYYKEGNLKEKGVFNMGLKNGEWYEYKKDGTIDKIIKWDEGKKIGVTFDSSTDKMNVKYLSKKEKRAIKKEEKTIKKTERKKVKEQKKLDKQTKKELKLKENELKKSTKNQEKLTLKSWAKSVNTKSLFKKDEKKLEEGKTESKKNQKVKKEKVKKVKEDKKTEQNNLPVQDSKKEKK